LLGIRIGKTSGADEKCVFILRGKGLAKRLSVNDLRKLPKDNDGYSILQMSG